MQERCVIRTNLAGDRRGPEAESTITRGFVNQKKGANY
jgi:hypothetical protein